MVSSALSVRLGVRVTTGLAWAYLVYMVWGMENMDVPAAQLFMPAMVNWGPSDLVLVFLMWVIMMAAMMLPSAEPMIRMYVRTAEGQSEQAVGYITSLFVSGYLLIWSVFSLLATVAQWGLLELRLVTPMMDSASNWLSGSLLIAAGVFQFSRFRKACLNNCRTPLGFLMTEWRPGRRGALIMGLRHGSYCLGCCAMLMLLLFALGVMNLVWILALTLIVLIEKLLPPGMTWPSHSLGLGFIAWGTYLLAVAL
jgi:predicted metal-binding membrane protein